VLITLDTLRWDRFGGNDPKSGPRGRNTMPNVERFAKGGVVFRKAYTSGAWTSIAVGTIMRGLLARKLQWARYYETTAYRLVKAPLAGRLAPDEHPVKMFPIGFEDPHWPLAHWLKRRGMRTIAVVDDGFSQMLSHAIGADRGFDIYREINVEPVTVEEAIREKKVGRRTTREDETTASFALAELRKYGSRKEPFFLWTHFFGAHTPNRDHAGAPKYGNSVPELYDHEVRFVDMQVERVLAAVRKLDRKVAVIITSDHGEAFFSRYRSHGADMSDEVLAVPLIIKAPGWRSRYIDTPVTSVDLLPTILAMTETPAPHYLDGIDLARLMRGEKIPERILLADTWQFSNDNKPYSELVAALNGKHKVVLDRTDHSFSVYDQTDPSAPPLRVEGLANGKLARSILAYLEDTGGQLNVQEGADPAPDKKADAAKPAAPRDEDPGAKAKAKADARAMARAVAKAKADAKAASKKAAKAAAAKKSETKPAKPATKPATEAPDAR
jgi:arylsulfatase A-like enzyme